MSFTIVTPHSEPMTPPTGGLSRTVVTEPDLLGLETGSVFDRQDER